MKRKMSMILSMLLLTTNLIACNQTETTDTTNANSNPPPTLQPSEVNVDVVKVILEGNYIENQEDINKFLELIDNSTITTEAPIAPTGGYSFEFHLIYNDDTIREFSINSGVLYEYVDGEKIYRILNDTEDFNFILTLLPGGTTTPSEPGVYRPTINDIYDEARLLFNQLSSSTLDLDFEQQAVINDTLCFKVIEFNTFDELNSHLLTIFSQDIVDNFTLLEQSHIEYEGELFGIPSDVPTNSNIGKELSRSIHQELPITIITVEYETLENGEVTGSEFFDFICESIDDNWIFTSFPNVLFS